MEFLVKKLHTDDVGAFEEIFHLYHEKVYLFIFSYVKHEALAKDLCQQLFIRLWNKRKLLSAQKPLDNQVFLIARNLTIDELRKIAREKAHHQRYGSKLKTFTTQTEEAVLMANLEEHFEAAVQSLPPRCRTILQLNRKQGLSYKEIALKLSISPKTVEVQMSKALKVLRKRLGAFYCVIW